MLFSSQDPLQEVQEISDLLLASAPSDQQQMSAAPVEPQSEPKMHHDHCPKHGGPSRSPESQEDIIGALSGRAIGEMVVKESSGLLFATENMPQMSGLK